MSNALEVTDNNFDTEVLKSQKLTIVDFWAPWCGPCRKLGPVLDEIAQELGEDIKVTKVNTDENLKTAKEYSISGLPSILIFKEGKAVEKIVGLMPKSNIINSIKKHL